MLRRFGVPVAAFALLAGCVTVALAQPESVPRLTERRLDKASYVELARQWQEYIDTHGESAEALVNLGMAYDYSEELEAALTAARRAVALDGDHPKALAFLGKMLATYGDDEDGALEVLLHCREVAPDYDYGITMLAATYLHRGELGEASATLKVAFERQIISRPLQDYAYNMLVGLPEGAVLITAGDNDTFPPLALQAGMDFRTDVIVINRSLLNAPEYAEAVFAAHPTIRPDYNIEAHEVTMVDGQPTILANALIKAMIAEARAPIYIAASANYPVYGYEPAGRLEGINIRAGEKGMAVEESARMFLEVYRLDSATDWGFAWSLAPMVSKLLSNYVASMIKLAEEKGISGETRARLLDRAEEMATFHENEKMLTAIRSLRKK